MNIKFWKQLKEYFETEYDGIVAREEGIKFAKEIQDGDATFLSYADYYKTSEVVKWIRETIMYAGDEDFEDLSIAEIFPNLHDYRDYADEIASYYLWQDIDKFKKEMKSGNEEYIKYAIQLDWEMMLGEIPGVKDIFMF